MKPRPGVPYPLGAAYDGAGTNFVLASEGATAVELCLFGEGQDDRETARFAITEQTDRVWDIYLSGIQPGQRYGYWRGADQTLAEFAYRLTGSSDLYAAGGRSPTASINFITAHDGFTLADLVAYNQEHNQANGEDNRDGEDHNRSWNCGHKGPTDDPRITQLRSRQKRNLLATLVIARRPDAESR